MPSNIATINQLPHELLTYIFFIIAVDKSMNPMLISRITHVCSLWREMTLSMGDLWSRIVLTYPILPRHLSYVTAWLDRSGSYPLDILLDLRDQDWDWNEDGHNIRWQEMETIVRLILPHVKRWRCFELLTDTWAPIFTFLWYARKVESAPMLESLSISRCNAYFAARGQVFQPSSLAEPMALFGGIILENLRSVALVGVHIDWSRPTLRNLTELQFKFQASNIMPNTAQFRSILKACPQLSHLTIYGWGPRFMDSASEITENHTIRVSSLQKLSFGVLDQDYAIQLLSMFDCPALTHLVLEDVSRAVDPVDALQDATVLLSWLTGKSSTIRYRPAPRDPNHFPLHLLLSLELRGISSSTEQLVSFFQELISLTHLGMYDMEDETLSVLTIPGTSDLQEIGGSYLIPTLQEIDLQDVDPEIVLNVVSHRASVGGTFNRVSLAFRNFPPPTNSPTYLRLLGAGIDIMGHEGSDNSDSMSM